MIAFAVLLAVLPALAAEKLHREPSAGGSSENRASYHSSGKRALSVLGQQILKLEAPCDFSCCPCARYSYPYVGYQNTSACMPCSSWRSAYVEPEYYDTCSSYGHDECGYYGDQSYIRLRRPFGVFPSLSYSQQYHGHDRLLSSLYFPQSTSHWVYADTYDPYHEWGSTLHGDDWGRSPHAYGQWQRWHRKPSSNTQRRPRGQPGRGAGPGSATSDE